MANPEQASGSPRLKGPFDSWSKDGLSSDDWISTSTPARSHEQDFVITSEQENAFPKSHHRDFDGPDNLDFTYESCRDWIVLELGEIELLPSLLSYEVGIQEIRQRLILRYGDERIGEAMAVVYDLIEDKRYASGWGLDDGDRWAPWRYRHRKRHDDLSDPGTPRFPHMILPSIVRPSYSTIRSVNLKNALEKESPSSVTAVPSTIYDEDETAPQIHEAADEVSADFVTSAISQDLDRDVVLYEENHRDQFEPTASTSRAGREAGNQDENHRPVISSRPATREKPQDGKKTVFAKRFNSAEKPCPPKSDSNGLSADAARGEEHIAPFGGKWNLQRMANAISARSGRKKELRSHTKVRLHQKQWTAEESQGSSQDRPVSSTSDPCGSTLHFRDGRF